MSIRDYMDSRERFEYDDNRMLESERETERRERFVPPTDEEVKQALEARNLNKETDDAS